MFFVTNPGNFRFRKNVFNTLTMKQTERRKSFSKNWSIVFQLKVLRLKRHYFHKKLPCQKPILRQTEWGVQNGPITINGVLPFSV